MTLLHIKYTSFVSCGCREEDFFPMYFHYKSMEIMTCQVRGLYGPQGLSAGFIRTSTIHCSTQNVKALGHVVSEKKIFLMFFFSNCKTMEVTDPRGGAIFDPRDMIRRIYAKLQITMLHNYIEALDLVVSEKKILHVFPFIKLWQMMKPPGRGLYRSKGHGWQAL